jgi:hypothetical protein
MEATKVMTNHTSAIRAVVLCCGDCAGEEIVMPSPYADGSGIPLRWHGALLPRCGLEWPDLDDSIGDCAGRL